MKNIFIQSLLNLPTKKPQRWDTALTLKTCLKEFLKQSKLHDLTMMQKPRKVISQTLLCSNKISRYFIYFLESETSWAHIESAEKTTLKYGIAYSWYVDSHSIFRFVQGRDSFWRKHIKVTDEADPQFKQVLDELQIKLIYALSPQAKGKIERPYSWLQDRIVRICAREGIAEINDARVVLASELKRCNSYQVHSTTGEIPDERFFRAFDEKRSLFREFVIPAPFTSTKDIFALRDNRVVNAYRKIAINRLELNVSGVPLRERVYLRIVPDKKSGIAEIRFWYKDKLVGIQKVKNEDLNISNF